MNYKKTCYSEIITNDNLAMAKEGVQSKSAQVQIRDFDGKLLK